jgi:hypothetical protein
MNALIIAHGTRRASTYRHAAGAATRFQGRHGRFVLGSLALIAAAGMLRPAPAHAEAVARRLHKEGSGSTLPEPEKRGGWSSYNFRFQLWRKPAPGGRANFLNWTPAQMMGELNAKFSHYFTFTGCGQHLSVGQRCDLKTITGTAPVQVIAIASDGFALKSLPGHPEGANRTIRFQFQPFTNAAEISSMSLTVDAWGPSSKASLLGPLNSNTVAKKSWDIFQNNIRDRFPAGSPGTSI